MLIPDHDAGVFNPPVPPPSGPLSVIVRHFFCGLRRWDAVYLLHVSEHGYTYENTLVFFPGAPLLWRVLAPYGGIDALLFSAVVVNTICVCCAALVLQRLGLAVLGDEKLAMQAAYLYCVNPAAVFFAAPYTEALYSVATFTGMLMCQRCHLVWASVAFAIAGACRSNGVVNCGFIAYTTLQIVLTLKYQHQSVIVHLTYKVVILVASLVLCITPFIVFQWYAASVYCSDHPVRIPDELQNYARHRGYHMPGQRSTLPSWCLQTLRLSYSNIQRKHWGVGFLRYYEWRQLPNFLLASPMAFLATTAAILYFRSMGIGRWLTLGFGGKRENLNKNDGDDDYQTPGFLGRHTFVYVVHLCGLLAFAIIFMHIQVLTRFITSSSPVLYWYVASLTTQPVNQTGPKTGHCSRMVTAYTDFLGWDSSSNLGRFALFYFHAYFVIGVAAFSNFLPWT